MSGNDYMIGSGQHRVDEAEFLYRPRDLLVRVGAGVSSVWDELVEGPELDVACDGSQPRVLWAPLYREMRCCLLNRETKISNVGTVDTISLSQKVLEEERTKAATMGYHSEPSRTDSMWTPRSRGRGAAKLLEVFDVFDLRVVARDGIEPPTPAFSGLRSTS